MLCITRILSILLAFHFLGSFAQASCNGPQVQIQWLSSKMESYLRSQINSDKKSDEQLLKILNGAAQRAAENGCQREVCSGGAPCFAKCSLPGQPTIHQILESLKSTGSSEKNEYGTLSVCCESHQKGS